MDCRTAQLLAAFLRPHQSELDADQIAAIESHLRICPSCAQVIHSERKFDERMTKAMRCVAVPEHLKSTILNQLKPGLPRWYEKRSFQIRLGIAASFLLAIWLIFGNRPTNLQLETIVEHQIQPQPSELAVRWLQNQGVEFAPEFSFNLDLVASYGTRDFMNRTVPALFLVNPEKQVSAQIFILQSSQFNWKEIPDLFSGLGVQIALIPDRERPERIAYLVFYTTPDLEPFRDLVSRS